MPANYSTMSAEEASTIIDQIFSKVRGQSVAKQKLKNKILSARVDGFVKPTLLVASAGLGKSLLLKAFRDASRAVLGRKTAKFADGSECGTKTFFVEEFLVSAFNDVDRHLEIDEVHACKPPILAIIRQMLQPDAERSRHSFTPAADHEVVFDPSKQSVIIATNKIDKLDTALVSRFDRIDLALYSDSEMEEILHDAIGNADIQFNANTLRVIAECNRGTARDIVHWCDAIREHLTIAGKKTVNKADVKEIIRLRQTFPLGVTQNELNTLLLLEKNGPSQLKELAAGNIVDSKEQNSNEKYLLQRRLITIEGKRHLSAQGSDYLKMLREEGYIAKAENKRIG